MIELIEFYETLAKVAAIMIPVVAGLVEAVKRLGEKYGLPTELLPFVSILFGTGLSFLILHSFPPSMKILTGLVTGLGAVGFYEITKQGGKVIKK